MTATLQSANLVGTLSSSYYEDPSLLWNAQPASAPSVNIVGNQLTISAAADVAPGTYQIQVTASDGTLSSSKSFTVTVQGNTAPQISTIASVVTFNNRSQSLALKATDAQNDAITFNATIVGTFATPPATLVLVGNQLTIHTSPDFVGGFDVRIAASDGTATSSTTFRVTVNASSVAYRFNSDFNGDGVKDTAFVNQNGEIWVSLKTAGGTFTNQKWAFWSAASAFATIQTGDVNGDGKSDLIAMGLGGYVFVGASTGAAFTTTRWSTWSASTDWRLLQAGDFNGDGKTDLLGFGIGGYVWVGLSTGTTFNTTLWGKWGASSGWSTITFADVNGDGKLDLIGKNTLNRWYVGYSNGVSFNMQIWSGSTPPV